MLKFKNLQRLSSTQLPFNCIISEPDLKTIRNEFKF